MEIKKNCHTIARITGVASDEIGVSPIFQKQEGSSITVSLERAAQNAEEEIFASLCWRLEKDYRKKERRSEALESFVRLFSMAADEQKEWSWLGICYLHTTYSILIRIRRRCIGGQMDFLNDLRKTWKP